LRARRVSLPGAALAALAALAAAADEPPQDAAKDAATLPKFRFEAVLHDYEPLSDRETRLAELFWAGVTADWSRGVFAAKAEVRGTEGTFRPFYSGSVWLEEGWAAVATPAGGVRMGKVVPAVGLPDETFSGTLFSYDGVTRNPGWGAALVGEAPTSGLDALAWNAAWIGQNDHVSWEEEGRDVESDPERILRDGLSARVTYLVNRGLWSIKPGVSAATARLVARDGTDEFRRSDLALDLTATFGPLAFFVEGFWRSSRPCEAGTPCRLAYDDARASLVGFRAEFPTVVYRYVYSRWHYLGAQTVEELHLPGAAWTPVKGLTGTIEYSARTMKAPAGASTVKAFQLGLAVSF
jgi:hypothetical protein